MKRKGMKMKILFPMMALAAIVALADDDEFLIKSTTSVEATAETTRPKSTQRTKPERPKEKLRKCYRCFGKGKQTVSVREACERCEGTGYVDAEVELKDTVNGRYWWESNRRTTRKVQRKKTCPQCNRRGMLPVKKEIDCPKCNGTGLLTKDDKPPTVVTKNVDDAASPNEGCEGEAQTEKVVSVADRIRAGGQAKLGSFEISVARDLGWVEFDFKANDGKFIVRNKETEFVTKWSGRGADAVYAYKDNVELVGYKAGQRQFPADKEEFESFDWSHRSIATHVGDVVVFMNKDGRFLAVKVLKVNDREYGADSNLLHFEFRIY